MSIAWSTVVLVVLLLPGFFFLWGFYAPNQVTRESVPASPLGQLAAVVIVSFLCHASLYVAINSSFCRTGWTACIDFDQLAALLRADLPVATGANPPRLPAPSVGRMLDAFAGSILLYFIVASVLTGLLGYTIGRLVEAGALPLTRHRYLFMLEESRRHHENQGNPPNSKVSKLVRAHILSRTSHDDSVLIYDGILQDFFAKSDGTISYVVLRGARSG